MIKIRTITSRLVSDLRDPLDGSPSSAYDALVRKVSDCDSFAQVQSLIFDMMGYNTQIMDKPGHAKTFVQIEGKWFDVETGFTQATNDFSYYKGVGYKVHTSKTY